MTSRFFGAINALLLMPTPALAGDRELVAAVDRGVAPLAGASRAAATGAPSAVQVHYDRARGLQEQIRAALPYSPSCRSRGGWAARYAAAEVAAAEGLDRLQPARARRYRAVAAAARARLARARSSCRSGRAVATVTVPVLIDPRPLAASFGDIAARVPAGADAATLVVDGASAGRLAIAGGIARARLADRTGRADLEVRFTRAGRQVGVARSRGVWLLPGTAVGPVRAADLDAGWQARARTAAAGFDGIAGVWIQDLASGRAAAWNAGALFPAASMVKLGVLVEAVRRMGPRPEGSSLAHDAQALGAWSSNLAANRLLGRIGGSAAAREALRRMGATSSTYTGPYIVATGRPPIDAPRQPPRVSGRVTSAADMAAVMRTIHAAAASDAAALAATGMTGRQARLALGLLLASEPAGDNRGLFRDALGPDTPAAQKHGWISSARHSAAIVYTPRGPVVIVALTYRPSVTRAAAARLGADLIAITTSGG